MKAIMVMFDSLNRHFLPNYGNTWVHAPNFRHLGEKALCFDRCYTGSLPCMPARRELHTGRYNFLHRSWGPIEPFDDSMPAMLDSAGIHTHLISDHGHYWEDGGATYHQRYSTWEIVRGQEGDHWKGYAGRVEKPVGYIGRWWRQDWINRPYTKEEKNHPQTQCFDLGLEFIETNKNEDNWFLQIETFDPHEPFVSPDVYAEFYKEDYSGPQFDWPEYKRVSENPEQVEHVRRKYAGLLSMCDRSLGRVIDIMDKYDLWKDTMLIVNTDHGFLLGEHGWWAKNVQPFYEEITHIPLFIWDPRTRKQGERRQALVQTIDIAPTLLGFFGVPLGSDMQGGDLEKVIDRDAPLRDSALFGMFGSTLNCIKGNHVYMLAPNPEKLQLLHNYTLMPTHMRSLFSADELRKAELSAPFPFTKGCPLLRIPAETASPGGEAINPMETFLFDLETDPKQERPLDAPDIAIGMKRTMVDLLKAGGAPEELYELYGLNRGSAGDPSERKARPA
jgi:arylsulfatase A-like enzyme